MHLLAMAATIAIYSYMGVERKKIKDHNGDWNEKDRSDRINLITY